MQQDVFFDTVRRTLFGGKLAQSQVDGMNGLLSAFDLVGDRDQDTLAYGLATAFHETGRRMVPVREGFAKSDAGARRAVNNLAKKRGPKSAVARYAKPTGPHGHVYYGRGYVQLTWLKNYAASSADAGVDLVANPDAMLDPVISARVLFKGLMDGRWNGQDKGLGEYEGADDVLSDAEAEEARRTVNVKDKAQMIAGYHRKFYDALNAAGWKPTTKAARDAPVRQRTDQNPIKKPATPELTVSTKGRSQGVIPLTLGLIVGGYATVAAWWNESLQPVIDWLIFWN